MKRMQTHGPAGGAFGLFLALVLLAPLAHAEDGLVDRLLSLLSGKNLPKIQIPAPPEKTAAPAAARENGLLEIAPSFLPVYAAGEDDEDIPPVLPFFSSAPVIKVQPQVRTLLIMVPDASREAARAYAFARSAQDEASARMPETAAADSLLFVPQFLRPEDIAAQGKNWPDGGRAMLRWAGEGWIYGAQSVENEAQPRRTISSYAALDFALLLLARPRLLPALRRVVIAGAGTGGDFVQRYSFFGRAPDVLAGEGVEVRFVAAQASSYLYPDVFRVRSGSEKDGGNGDFAPVDAKACPAGNAYPYGLEGVPPYAAQQGVNELRLRYSARQVIVLAGAGATLPLTDSTPAACALALQGPHTAARAKNYFSALQRLYGSELDSSQKIYLVRELNEDALALWRSRCGISALFGDGGCAPDDVGGRALRVLE